MFMAVGMAAMFMRRMLPVVLRVFPDKDVGIVDDLVQKVCVDLYGSVNLLQLLFVADCFQKLLIGPRERVNVFPSAVTGRKLDIRVNRC
jgi:hypothetical protein